MRCDSAISIKNLVKTYGINDVVFSDLSVEFPIKEIIGLVGENGSGKTTFIKLISGMTRQDSGEISILGNDVCDEKTVVAMRKYISILGDANRALYWNLTGMDNIEYFWTLKTGKALKEMPANILENIERFNMKSFIHNKVEKYSKGMKQRLLLLISLINQPKILFMDEPLNGLDFENAFILKQIITEFVKESGGTVIITSHDQNFINEVCDSQYIIKDKQIKRAETFSSLNKEITLFMKFSENKCKQDYINKYKNCTCSINNNILKISSDLNDFYFYKLLARDINKGYVEILEVR